MRRQWYWIPQFPLGLVMYDNILYPTDGSTGADAALETARDFASQYGATVHILHVVNSTALGYETGSGSEEVRSGMVGGESDEDQSGMLGGDPDGDRTGMIGGDPEELRQEHREEAEAIIEDVATRFEGLDTEPIIRVGEPHHVILGYAARNGIDMIVMGTHGRTGLDRYLLGSVTEKVVRMSDVPVVTVRRNGDSEPEIGPGTDS